MSEWIEIDGAVGEGGGQIVRTSLSLAAVTGRPLRIYNIRAGRPRPGLAAQHLTAARAVAEICGGELTGDSLGSQTLELRPGPVRPGRYDFDVAAERGSAGATSLVLQTVLPPLALTDGASEIVVHGGTNVAWSPSFEYLLHVFAPCLARMSVEIRLMRLRAGFYPHGGGTVVARIAGPCPLRPLVAEGPGDLREVVIHSVVSSCLPAHIGRRQIKGCRQAIGETIGAAAVREIDERPDSGGPGTCVTAAAVYACGHGGFSALGERGKPAERVGAEAGHQLVEFLRTGAAIDARLSDQILLWAALAHEPSAWTTPEVTRHFKTNAYVIARFLDVDIRCDRAENGLWRVTVVSRHQSGSPTRR